MEKPVIIQGAMSQEIVDLVNCMTNCREIDKEGFPFYSGGINNIPVVVSKTYVGKINAALATVLGIQLFEPRLIINQGTAGAHKENYRVGDIIVGKRYINYDSLRTITERKMGEGYAISNKRISGERYNGRMWEDVEEITADERVVSLAMLQENPYGKVYAGTIATGDGFNKECDAITELRNTFDTDCEEMETFAAAQVSGHFAVPFIGVRVISNNELREMPFDPESSSVCQEFCAHLIENITGVIR